MELKPNFELNWCCVFESLSGQIKLSLASRLEKKIKKKAVGDKNYKPVGARRMRGGAATRSFELHFRVCPAAFPRMRLGPRTDPCQPRSVDMEGDTGSGVPALSGGDGAGAGQGPGPADEDRDMEGAPSCSGSRSLPFEFERGRSESSGDEDDDDEDDEEEEVEEEEMEGDTRARFGTDDGELDSDDDREVKGAGGCPGHARPRSRRAPRMVIGLSLYLLFFNFCYLF